MLMKTPIEAHDWRNNVAQIMTISRHLAKRRKELNTSQFELEALNLFQINIGSTAKKISKIIDNKILSDPAHYDRLPAQWAILYEVSFLPDDILRQKIEDGSLMNITKYEIGALRGRGTVEELKQRAAAYRKRNPDVPKADKRGAPRSRETRRKISENNLHSRISVPEGIPLSEFCRKAIRREREGMAAIPLCKEIGISVDNYRKAKAILTLADNANLNTHDRGLVNEAITLMDETRRVGAAREMVDKVVTKYWGRGHNRSSKMVKSRTAKFSHATKVIMETCLQWSELEIPMMQPDEFDRAEQQIDYARQALSRLIKNLRRERR